MAVSIAGAPTVADESLTTNTAITCVSFRLLLRHGGSETALANNCSKQEFFRYYIFHAIAPFSEKLQFKIKSSLISCKFKQSHP